MVKDGDGVVVVVDVGRMDELWKGRVASKDNWGAPGCHRGWFLCANTHTFMLHTTASLSNVSAKFVHKRERLVIC